MNKWLVGLTKRSLRLNKWLFRLREGLLGLNKRSLRLNEVVFGLSEGLLQYFQNRMRDFSD